MPRRKRHEDHLNHEAWAIPYGDLVTLLLAFFVVMYAISSVNEGKYRVLSDSLFAAFRGAPRTLQPVQVGEKQVGSGADVKTTHRRAGHARRPAALDARAGAGEDRHAGSEAGGSGTDQRAPECARQGAPAGGGPGRARRWTIS